MIGCKRRVSKFKTCRLCICQAVTKTGLILHAKYQFCRKVLKDLKTRNNNRVKATDALRTLPNFFFFLSCIHEVWRSECQILCTTTADKKKAISTASQVCKFMFLPTHSGRGCNRKAIRVSSLLSHHPEKHSFFVLILRMFYRCSTACSSIALSLSCAFVLVNRS